MLWILLFIIFGLIEGVNVVSDDYRRGRTVVSLLNAHLVFTTKYRRCVFSNMVYEVMRVSFQTVCMKFNTRLVEMNGEGDHVHLIVEYPPTVQLSKLVNSLKGVSSRMIRKENFPEVAKKLWGTRLWSPSYFVTSCGGAPLDVIKRYVENQGR